MNENIGRGTARPGRTRTLVETLVAFTLLVGAAAVGLSGGDPASAAGIPLFPDNLVIFPDRDFLSAEGFDGHVGENALVEVFRGGEVIGAAEVTLEPGGVPFEVNHPGGYCWGNDVIGGSGFLSGPAAAGTLPNVTPDIRPNDDIRVTFADGTTSGITTQDGYVANPPDNGTDLPAVSGVDTVPAGDLDFIPGFEHRFTVRGRIATADPTFVEQRIVNPDLTDTAVGRRDIRAVPDPLGFLPDGNNSYMSRLVVDDANDTFVATYLFNDPAIATTAATGGGVRLLTWQATDLNANRQGITIAEFGEPGGPGFGGCPNGPLQSGPPGPTNVQASLTNSAGEVTVTWVPATAIPGTPPITGYRVHAVGTTGQVEEVEIGRRINGPTASGTTITGLVPFGAYDVQVVSVSSVGETFPAVHATFDTTQPMLSADPGPGLYRGAQQVTLSSDEPGEIWYTVDGSAVLDAAGDVMPGTPGVSGPQRYDGPITVDADTTINAVAFDLYGNSSVEQSFGYVITSTPLTPTLSGQAGTGSIELAWDATVDPTITSYTVTLYDAPSDGNIVGRQVIASGDVPNDSATFGSLDPGVDYWATIVAENLSGASPESDPLGPLTPYGSFVAIAGADQTVVRGDVVYLDGSASIGAAAYSWAASDPAVTLTGSDTATPSFTFPATSVGPVTLELTITGESGATSTDTVTITAEDVVANAGTAQTVVRGSSVTLDGTGSSPLANLSYSWVSVGSAPALTGSDTATPSFVFPATSAGPHTFELTVTDLSGTAATDTVTITAEDVVAKAGADQTVVRGSTVTLDGTGSSPSANLSYSWVSTDPGVVLTGSASATPSFIFPSTSPGPLTFELTVSDQSGASATDSVIVSASNNDPLAVARAEYRRGKNEWRFDGAATVLVDNTITLRLNRYTNGTLAGTTPLSTGLVTVDAAGVWTVRYNPPAAERPTAAGSTYTITVTSSQGGLLLDEPISIRN
jgi:hypothetical protein